MLNCLVSLCDIALFFFGWMRVFYYIKWIGYKVHVTAPISKAGTPFKISNLTHIQGKQSPSYNNRKELRRRGFRSI